MNKTNPEKAIKELTMVLMYLTRFNESDRFGSNLDISWKGYDFDIIDELDEEDYVRQGNHRSKSVVIKEEGIKLSQSFFHRFRTFRLSYFYQMKITIYFIEHICH